jgi:hypothetical protein
MAFVASALVTVGAQYPQTMVYATNDLLNDVVQVGYFNQAANRFRKGDQITVSGALDSEPFVKLIMVVSADGAVTVSTVAAA